MADGVDADAADHRGDGAVRLGLDPGRTVLEAEMREAGQQYATRCGARALGSDGMVSDGGCSISSAGG